MHLRQFQALLDFLEELPNYRLCLRVDIITPAVLGAAACYG